MFPLCFPICFYKGSGASAPAAAKTESKSAPASMRARFSFLFLRQLARLSRSLYRNIWENIEAQRNLLAEVCNAFSPSGNLTWSTGDVHPRGKLSICVFTKKRFIDTFLSKNDLSIPFYQKTIYRYLFKKLSVFLTIYRYLF